jgi:single-strand DNA-binding protein
VAMTCEVIASLQSSVAHPCGTVARTGIPRCPAGSAGVDGREPQVSEHNLVVLRGTLAGDPRTRELPSGSALTQFDVTTRDDGRAQSVPVAWFDAPASGRGLAAGTDVVVVGSVRRRFFRTAGATQSRTEVVAERIVAARRGREVRRLLESAGLLLDPLGAESIAAEPTADSG